MAVAFERRLASFQAARAAQPAPEPARLARATSAAAERLAAEVDGELVVTPAGSFVRLEGRGDVVDVDRERLARLPGQPPAGVPLVCLDTETTGLATAAGTLAFLVGLGWWQGPRFRQVQLLLPDHAYEPAMLDALRAHIPAGAWLVTYNGRTFDWPLLVTRYRMARREPPAHGGHLDLLPFVRRVFRHRMPDARLRTVERQVLGIHRLEDIDGWEIPGRYFDFLRGGPATPLRAVLQHNDEDVRSLALLVAHLERRLADREARATSPAGDLAGLARAFARERRLPEALDCLDAAVSAGRTGAAPARPGDLPGAGSASSLPCPLPEAERTRDPFGRSPVRQAAAEDEATDLSWLSPRRRPDFGGTPLRRGATPWPALASVVAGEPWTDQRIAVDRARMLRRLGRHRDAERAWREIAGHGGREGIHAWIEVAKLREHRLGDPDGALEATREGRRLLDRLLQPGRALAPLDRDLATRAARLTRRLAGRRTAVRDGSGRSLAPGAPGAAPTAASAAP